MYTHILVLTASSATQRGPQALNPNPLRRAAYIHLSLSLYIYIYIHTYCIICIMQYIYIYIYIVQAR